MSLDTPGQRECAGPASPLQFVNIEITPLIGGKYSVVMQATLLDEQELEFVGQDLAHTSDVEYRSTRPDSRSSRADMSALRCAGHVAARCRGRLRSNGLQTPAGHMTVAVRRASGCSTTTSAAPSSAAGWS